MRHALPRLAALVGALALVALCPLAGTARGALDPRLPDRPLGPQDGVVILMRHAEKPAAGAALSAEGAKRAAALAAWLPAEVAGLGYAPISAVAASLDSRESDRPRLTAAPTAQALGLPVAQPFADAQVKQMARWLRARPKGSVTLVAWHHRELPALIAALGADPCSLLTKCVWARDDFSHVIVLRFNDQQRLLDFREIAEPAALTAGLTEDQSAAASPRQKPQATP